MSLETHKETGNFGETNVLRQFLDAEAPTEIKENNTFRQLIESPGKYSSREVEKADALVSQRLESAEEVRADFPEAKPMESIYCRNWERTEEKLSIAEDLKRCNPHYEEGPMWQENCQRTVPTYEMRRRGYDVTAKPLPALVDTSLLSRVPLLVWKNPERIICEGNGRADIENKMKEWGDGARAQVHVAWRDTNFAHTFVAEQVDGKTVFVDPQDGSEDASDLFRWVEDGSVSFWRIDDQDVTIKIRDCCKEVERT